MSIYSRTTRICTINQLDPALTRALQEYFLAHHIGDLHSETRLCCETVAEKRNPGKLADWLEGNPDTTTRLVILMTTGWLIWARFGDRSGMVVTGASMKVIRIKTYTLKQTKDMQLEVTGFVNETKEYVKGNLEMGPETDAQRFCDEVGKAIDLINPPAKRKLRKWMGG